MSAAATLPLPLAADRARRGEWVLLAAALVLFLVRLGAADFWEPDEPRHGAIAEEMRALEHGPAQIVLPRLAGEVYTQKPPLFYWLAALAGLPFGHVSEAAARLPSALAGVGAILLAIRLGRAMFGATAGLLAGATLLTLPTFVDLVRSARPDALLTFFVTAALYYAWRVERGWGSIARDRMLMHLSIGLGMLTKGPVALLLPLFGVLGFLALERRLRDVRRFVSMPSLALSLGPILAWLGLAFWLAPPGFMQAAVGHNVLQRFFSGTEHERGIFFYLGSFPATFLPWSLAWPLAASTWRRRHAEGEARRGARFLLVFVCCGLLLFSLSKGKRDAYLLPLFPATALLTAAAIEGWLRERMARASSPAAAQLVPRALALALALGFAAQLLYQAAYLPTLDSQRSIRAAAVEAARRAPPATPIGVVRNGSLLGGVAYYGGRPVQAIGSAKGLRRFLAHGGRALVLEAEHLDVVRSVATAEIVFEQQLQDDPVLVVVASPSGE